MASRKSLQQKMSSSASFTPEEMLSFITSSSNIDLSRVRNDMIKAEIEKVIETTHTSPITQGPDGRWRTSVYEGKKRRLIAKTSLDDLKLEVYCFYTGILKEDVFRDHTIESLYPRWKEYKSLHKSRKTYVSALHDGNVNINTIRELVGHKDERTTLGCYVYDRNSDAEKKNMIQKALAS